MLADESRPHSAYFSDSTSSAGDDLFSEPLMRTIGHAAADAHIARSYERRQPVARAGTASHILRHQQGPSQQQQQSMWEQERVGRPFTIAPQLRFL